MNQDILYALWGGVLIGIAVSLMLLWNGRVTGIAGIVNGILTPAKGDTSWRVAFIGGMFAGGLTLRFLHPDLFSPIEADPRIVALAGLLVGFGTILGSGCTSGHGVCGISRMSPRSLIATLVFMISGVVAVVVFKNLGIL